MMHSYKREDFHVFDGPVVFCLLVILRCQTFKLIKVQQMELELHSFRTSSPSVICLEVSIEIP